MASELPGHKGWIVRGEELLLEASPWLTVTRQVIELPDGRLIDDYYQVRSPSYVEVVPVDPQGRVLVLWRYKHGARRSSMGFPGGYIESGESADRAAKRELQEECALQSSDWSELGACCIDGNRGTAEVHIFIAWGCTEAEVIPTDDLEAGDALWIGPKELRVHLEEGRFCTLGAYAAALLALPVLEQLYAPRIR